ncbi:MAG: mobilization protein [Rhizobiaceae bacterium]
MRRSSTDRLTLLRQRRDQIDAQLKALEARNKQAERKADTRRKVIAGALALEHFERNRDSEFGRIMLRLLDEYVVRPHDRALFPDLPNPGVGEHAPAATSPRVEFSHASREAGSSAPQP